MGQEQVRSTRNFLAFPKDNPKVMNFYAYLRSLDGGRKNESEVAQISDDVIQSKPGRTHLAEHRIVTGAAGLIRQPPYRLPHSYREEVLKELEGIKKDGIIEPSVSEWVPQWCW